MEGQNSVLFNNNNSNSNIREETCTELTFLNNNSNSNDNIFNNNSNNNIIPFTSNTNLLMLLTMKESLDKTLKLLMVLRYVNQKAS
jgi:hypothetical protein